VILGTNISLQCGDEICSWDGLHYFISCFEEDIKKIRDSVPARIKRAREGNIDGTSSLAGLPVLNAPSSLSPPNLFRLCLEHGESDCMDQRDKIFGLHSFAANCCTEAVPVDYSLEVSELSRRLIQHQSLVHSEVKAVRLVDLEKLNFILGLMPEKLPKSVLSYQGKSSDTFRMPARYSMWMN